MHQQQINCCLLESQMCFFFYFFIYALYHFVLYNLLCTHVFMADPNWKSTLTSALYSGYQVQPSHSHLQKNPTKVVVTDIIYDYMPISFLNDYCFVTGVKHLNLHYTCTFVFLEERKED